LAQRTVFNGAFTLEKTFDPCARKWWQSLQRPKGK
jgi:hypothetical protein